MLSQMTDQSQHPSAIARIGPMRRQWSLLKQMVWRDVEMRYRGTGLGLIWTLLMPLLMLGVYTLVFGTIFQSRWAGASESASPVEFAVILFAGLIVFQLFSDVIMRAPSIVISNANLVTRVVFPLEILVPVVVGSAAIHAAVSLMLLLPFIYFVFDAFHWTVVFLPVVLAPFLLLIAGLAWFLASVGTFVRDFGQFVGPVVTAMLFLAPIFFPLTSMPAWIRPLLFFNPVTVPVEQLRRILIFGQLPQLVDIGVYAIASLLIAVLGYTWFQMTRRGFADVL